ncbi:hypothetical protein [Aquimarina sp. RZ0]|uniref:hypothetical protein n=1 Tax=Aquimarina sp. RZ0 TaxID=2607730 RepID=UPI0011F1257E|nr:hypothetical protein [Aquimarina sp. RZ0]KAA1247453.1 hypothetical protein F0000_03060 [Aquimarina sp. RZ0]
MKRPAHLIKNFAILSISTSLFYSCQKDADIELVEEASYQKKIEMYEKKIEDLEQQLGKTNLQKSNRRGRPRNIISFGQAKKLFKNYDPIADLISQSVGTDQNGESFMTTRSLFYDINDLKEYLSYIEELSKEAGVATSGIRFYFGRYTEDHVSSTGSNRNARRQTFFIAPTTEEKIDDHIVHIGYTIQKNGKVKFLDKVNGFPHRRNQRSKAYQDSGFDFAKSGNEDDPFSLIANNLGASPPDYND